MRKALTRRERRGRERCGNDWRESSVQKETGARERERRKCLSKEKKTCACVCLSERREKWEVKVCERQRARGSECDGFGRGNSKRFL